MKEAQETESRDRALREAEEATAEAGDHDVDYLFNDPEDEEQE